MANNVAKMTLGELREFHVNWHVGFIWECPHCRQRYMELLEKKADQHERGKSSHTSVHNSSR